VQYYWYGLDDGYYFVTNIDSTPAHVYNFSVRTRTTATSSPVFGAKAAAQIDYGSGGLDAPNLGPLNLFHANNRSEEFFWIEYLLPPDWELTSC
jgi:hypothetical protein